MGAGTVSPHPAEVISGEDSRLCTLPPGPVPLQAQPPTLLAVTSFPWLFFFLRKPEGGQAGVQPTLSSACPWGNVGEQAGGAPNRVLRVLLIMLAFSSAGRDNEL